MADGFANPYSGLAQGLTNGVNIALSVDQAKRQRKQQEWENDFRVMSSGLSLSQAKGISPESSSQILNQSVAPVWKKWTGNDFPQVTPATVQDMSPLIKNIISLGEGATKGDHDWGFAFQEANKQIAGYHVQSKKNADVSEREKAALEAAMAPIKSGYQHQNAMSEKGGPDGGVNDNLKRMTDIEKQLADMEKIDQNMAMALAVNPELAKRSDILKVSPEALASMRASAFQELKGLNDQLPANMRREYITKQEFDKMKALGYSDEFIRSNSIVTPDALPAKPPAQPGAPVAQ